MPELPEVETIARGLRRTLAGRVVTAVEAPDPSCLAEGPASFASRVCGRTILGVRRRAKLLLLDMDPGLTLAVHLRMTGRLVASAAADAPQPHARLVLRLDNGGRLLFADCRRFGTVHAFSPGELELWPFYAALGPEPLEINAKQFASRFAGRGGRIKSLLLDQGLLAGVGNIYADEALHRAGICPLTRANRLTNKHFSNLFKELKAVLRQAIRENGSSTRDYRDAGGNAGAFQNSFQAYGRAGEPCLRCASPMVAAKVGGRTSTYCPACQPPL